MTQPLPIRRKPTEGAAGQQEQGQSPRERLRAHRQALASTSTKTFVLPGYDADNGPLGGELLVRYRRMLVEELTEAFTRERWVDGEGKYDTVAANAQFLVDACEDITIREPDGSITPLVEGHETTYTVNLETGQSLGTIMGVEHLPSIREQLVAEFGDNEIALNEHSRVVHLWMTSANTADLEKALGEPEAR